MSIKKFMTPDPVSVHMDDFLEKLGELFDAHQFHHLLVIDNDRLVGVISDRDYLKAISPNLGKGIATQKDLATLNKRVHQIMSRKPVTVHEDDSIQVAVDRFSEYNVSCLPVLGSNNRITGILTWRNLLRGMRVKKISG